MREDHAKGKTWATHCDEEIGNWASDFRGKGPLSQNRKGGPCMDINETQAVTFLAPKEGRLRNRETRAPITTTEMAMQKETT